MANFVFLIYYGEKVQNMEPTPEVMEVWNKWFKDLGDKIVDPGAPFNGNGQSVSKKSVDPVDSWPATAYLVVKADSMDAAVAISKGCPALEAEESSVRIYECMPM